MNKKSAKPNSTPYSKKKPPYNSIKSSIPNGRKKISASKPGLVLCAESNFTIPMLFFL